MIIIFTSLFASTLIYLRLIYLIIESILKFEFDLFTEFDNAR